MAKKLTPWNLYWVESDGVEDCFVVARNARSACRVEIDMNGFEPNEVRATQIIRVPDKVRLAYEKRKKHSWPWYVYGKAFFRGLGAQFRKVESKEEMLLEQVVYEIDDYIQTSWGQDELVSFLAFFDIHSRLVKKVFRGALYASLEYALHHWGRPKRLPKNFPSPKHKEDAGFFFEVFTPKKGTI